LLLQVPLGQVLELPLAEFKVGGASNSDLGTVTGDRHIVRCECSCLAPNLDSVVKVLFEGCNLKDLIVNWGCAVDDEFGDGFFCLYLNLNEFLSSQKGFEKKSMMVSCQQNMLKQKSSNT
jgi:hypothetical protein